MRRLWLALLLLAVIASGLLTGLYVDGKNQASADDAPDQVDLAERFQFTDKDGQPATLPIGERAVLVNFWGTWCPPCRHELPLLDEVNNECPGSVVGMVLDETEPAVMFLEKQGLELENYFIGLQDGVKVLESFGNAEFLMPYSIMFAGNGVVAATKTGPFANTDEIKEFQKNALDFQCAT